MKNLPALMENLSSSATSIKIIILRIFINQLVIKDEKKIIKRHQKKLQNLLDEKNKEHLTNFSSHVLTNEEHGIL